VSVPPSGTATRTPQQAATSLFNDVQSTSNAIERGDWLSAGIGATNVAMDVISLGGDPLGSISSAGFGWLIGHIKFLREPFDKLLGDANSIVGTATGWANAGQQLTSTAERYRQSTQQQTCNWTGPAADSYRTAAATQAKNLDALAKISKSVSDAVAGAGKALAEVRKAVIDTINQACNKIIMIIIEALAAAWGSFGASIAKGIAQSVQTAVSAAQKMLTKIQKLVSTLQKVMQLVQKVLQLAQAVKQLVQKIGGGANPGGGAVVQPLPVGSAVPMSNYGGTISAGTAPPGTSTTVNLSQGPVGPNYSYDAYTPGATTPVNYAPSNPGPGYNYAGFTPGSSSQLPPGVPSWGPSGPPPDAGYPASRVDQARWIGSAVQILVEHGVDPATIDTGRIAEIVTQNSGGNPHAVDLNHPEAQNGTPPKGLMMLTDPQFEQHRVSGHHNIYHPVDNLVAGIGYLLMISALQQGTRPAR
jgi:hypothetical protein